MISSERILQVWRVPDAITEASPKSAPVHSGYRGAGCIARRNSFGTHALLSDSQKTQQRLSATLPRTATPPVKARNPKTCPHFLVRGMAQSWQKVLSFEALGRATVLLMALAAFFATAAQANDITLVSNIGQHTAGNHGRLEPLAQRFNTGAHPLGYMLTSVTVEYINNEAGIVSAKVCTVTGADQPTSTCTDFTAPSAPQGGNRTFTAPGDGMFLASNTKYTVVLTPDDNNTLIYHRTTANDTEDPDSLSGWNIAGEYRVYNGTSWVADDDSHALKIRLKGSIIRTAGPNANATGAPDITGPAQVGGTLKAQMGDIADPDGLPSGTFPAGYSFQWIAVMKLTFNDAEFEIPGATSRTYTPDAADLGHTLKVRVFFIDGDSMGEVLTSAETHPVVPGPAPCPAESVWCTELTVGIETSNQTNRATGFTTGLAGDAFGSLDGADFTFGGTTYTVKHLTAAAASDLYLGTEPDLPADGAGLTLHVQRINGTRDLPLSGGSLRFQGGFGGNVWVFLQGNATIASEDHNPLLLRQHSSSLGRYVHEPDPGTRVMVRLSRQAGVSFDSPGYLAYESGEGAQVKVILTPAPTSPVTIPITATGQDGATSSDWSGIPASLTFAAGESSKTFMVTAVEDSTADEGESVLIEFGTLPSGVATGYLTETTVHFYDRASRGDLRLVGGDGLPTAGNEGRLEVFYQGQWGTVCNDRFDSSFKVFDSNPPRTVENNHAATLACELMGKGNKGELIDNSPYRIGDSDPKPIWLDDVRCEEGGTHWTGDQAQTLDQCFTAGIGRNNCTHNEDVALECTTVVQQTVITPLRVQFKDVPKTGHDGESALTFRLDFSEDMTLTPEDMRDHALEVSGATVTLAAIVDGRGDLWEFTLEPTGTDNVIILVSDKDSCTETGALCTALGAGLTNPISAVIPYIPQAVSGLTAAFQNVPEEHSGDRYAAYTVKLLFSEDVKVANKRMRKRILKLEGATLEEARRIDRRKDYWAFRIRPRSHLPITLSLKSAPECGARDVICTFDGKALSQPVTATIIGPPGMSVADAEVDEGPDATLDFVVTLDRAPRRAVTVNYETEDGTAIVDEDYVRAYGMLSFAAGEMEKTVSVQVLDDAHNEGAETLTLRLGGAVGAWLKDGEATGTINNSDHMPQAWLARFGRTVAEQVIDAVERRTGSAPKPGVAVTVAGQRFGETVDVEDVAARREDEEEQARSKDLAAWVSGKDEAREQVQQPGSQTVSAHTLLTGSAFSLAAESNGPGGGIGALWGRAVETRFDGRTGELSVTGDVTSMMLGTDWTREQWTAGLLVSHSRGDGSYRGADSGKVKSEVTGLYPYGRYQLNERVTVWGTAGYGEGRLTLTPERGGSLKTDMDLMMAAAGLRGTVLKAPATGGPELALKTDAMVVETSSEAIRGKPGEHGNLASATADVTRLRLGLEGRWLGLMIGSGTLEPRLEVGVRHDDGDAETGFGLDLGGGLAWSDPEIGIRAEVSGRGLLTHERSGFRQRGIAGSLDWDPRPDSGRGLRLTLRQTLGLSADNGVDALLNRTTLEGLAANDEGDEFDRRRLDLTLGYGLSAFGDRFTSTPEFGLGLTDSGRENSLGWRLVRNRRTNDSSALELLFEGRQRENDSDHAGPEHTIGFRLTARF